MATSAQRTPDTPAARAMAIIEAAQTAAASARRPGGPRPTITPSAPARRPAVARPVAPAAAPAVPVGDAGPQTAQILALVERVRAETRNASGRLDRLAASIDDLERARRTAPVAEAAPAAAPGPAATPAPASAPAAPPALAAHATPAPPRAPAPPVTPSPPAAADPSPPPSDTVSDTARIVALDLAATGLGRADVGLRLERDYGVTNVAAVLDAAFGRRR